MARPKWLRLSHTRNKIAPTECQQKPTVNEASILPQHQECSFSDLPPQLLEAILCRLNTDKCGARNPKDMFSAIGVCKSWRAAGHAVFFKDSWSSHQLQSRHVIQHPAQLITLCPLHHTAGGHIKCYVQRELVSSGFGSRLHRFTLSQGTEYPQGSGKFLLAAIQHGHQAYSIYLNRSCTGKPVAQLSSNVMRTSYVLTTPLAAASSSSSSRCSNSSSSARNSSGMKEKSKYAVSGAQQQQQWLQHHEPWPLTDLQQQQQHGWCGCTLCGSSAAAAPGRSGCAADAVRQELARVSYKLRVRGIMLPRRMSVAIPAPPQQQQLQLLSQPGRTASMCHLAQAAAAAALANFEIEGDTMQDRDQDIPLTGMATEAAAAATSYACTSSSSSSEGSAYGPTDAALHASSGSSSSSSNSPAGIRSGSTSDTHVPAGTLWRQQQQQAPPSPSFKAALQQQQQQRQQQQHLPLHYLHNKPPHWNEGLRCWCLNFRGRVRLASVKNFQLVTNPQPESVTNIVSDVSLHGSGVSFGSNSSGSSGGLSRASTSSSSNDDSSSSSTAAPVTQAGSAVTPRQLVIRGSPHTGGIVTQFGKVDTNVYILDYDPVLISGLQAFAVALTSFGTKVLL